MGMKEVVTGHMRSFWLLEGSTFLAVYIIIINVIYLIYALFSSSPTFRTEEQVYYKKKKKGGREREVI